MVFCEAEPSRAIMRLVNSPVTPRGERGERQRIKASQLSLFIDKGGVLLLCTPGVFSTEQFYTCSLPAVPAGISYQCSAKSIVKALFIDSRPIENEGPRITGDFQRVGAGNRPRNVCIKYKTLEVVRL